MCEAWQFVGVRLHQLSRNGARSLNSHSTHGWESEGEVGDRVGALGWGVCVGGNVSVCLCGCEEEGAVFINPVMPLQMIILCLHANRACENPLQWPERRSTDKVANFVPHFPPPFYTPPHPHPHASCFSCFVATVITRGPPLSCTLGRDRCLEIAWILYFRNSEYYSSTANLAITMYCSQDLWYVGCRPHQCQWLIRNVLATGSICETSIIHNQASLESIGDIHFCRQI